MDGQETVGRYGCAMSRSHWFDDVVKGLAAGSLSRRSALRGLGAVSGSIAALSAFPHDALARKTHPAQNAAQTLDRAHASATAAPVRLTPGVVRPRLTVPATFTSGPCTYKHGGGSNDMIYVATTVANGQTVTLTVTRSTRIEGTDRSRLTGYATNTIDVTAGGSPVVRLESQVTATRGGGAHHGTLSVRYGQAVRGARGADLSIDGKSVRGRVLGAERITGKAREKVTSARFDNEAAPIALAIDARLSAAIDSLLERFKNERGTCNGMPPRRRRAERRVQNRAAFLSPAIARRGELVVADVAVAPVPELTGGNAGVEPQNQYGAPSTPHCNSCMNAAGNQMQACWSTAAGSLFACLVCAAGDLIVCQSEATAAAVACWIPGAGCGEVICKAGTSCDSGDSCCGTDCCTGADVCLSGSTLCCPPGYTTACAGAPGYDSFCCGQQSVCCGNNGCCPPGSNCCGGKFCCEQGNACCGSVCCDAGSTCANPATSLCCGSSSIPCGPTCCDPYNGGVCLDATRGICGVKGDVVCGNSVCGPGSCLHAGTANATCCPGPVCGDRCCSLIGPTPRPFGRSRVPQLNRQASPTPTPGRLAICRRPNVPCRSELNGKLYSTCCKPNQICCGDQCCAVGLTCCADPQGNPRCNTCIK